MYLRQLQEPSELGESHQRHKENTQSQRRDGASRCTSRSLSAQTPPPETQKQNKEKKGQTIPRHLRRDLRTLQQPLGLTASKSCFDHEEVKSTKDGKQVESGKSVGVLTKTETSASLKLFSNFPLIHHCSVSVPKLGGSDPQTRSATHALLYSLKAAKKRRRRRRRSGE